MFIPSIHQEKVFNFIQFGQGNGIVLAVAGSGKTTTILQGINYVKKGNAILYLAFNREVVKEVRKKYNGLVNVEFSTLHAYGWHTMLRYNPSITRNKTKYNDLLHAIYDYLSQKNDKIKKYNFTNSQLNSLSSFVVEDENLVGEKFSDFKSNIIKLAEFARLSLVNNEEELEEIAYKEDVETKNKECKHALRLIELAMLNLDEIDFTDMIYLPIVLNIPLKTRDFVFVDECQDLNNAQIKLMLRTVRPGGRFIAVGDPNQAIYGFAGANEYSFKKFCEVENTTIFPLSICYRCDSSIINLAKQIVKEIEFFPENKEGVVNHMAVLSEIKDGDMVLCRRNLPLVKLCFQYIKKGIKAHIRGKDLAEEIIKLIKKSNTNSLPVLYSYLYNQFEKEKKRLMRRYHLTEKTVQKHHTFMAFKEKIEIIEMLGEGLGGADEIIKKINIIFSDTDKEGIILSTIHKAKGLENDRIFIINRDLMDEKYWNADPEESNQELNLTYVAYTRAKKYLGFVVDFDGYEDVEKNSKKDKVLPYKESDFVGKPNETMSSFLKVLECKDLENKFGSSVLTTMQDDNGNILKTFQVIPYALMLTKDNNEKVFCSFEVFKHNEYNGAKDTLIKRVKLDPNIPKIKKLECLVVNHIEEKKQKAKEKAKQKKEKTKKTPVKNKIKIDLTDKPGNPLTLFDFSAN